ncbi:MAG: hypothetical protein K0S32_1751 [Bacteroidetes bacterium]|jgi:hypothetical protein|nr:hypothetical protein [Bacteroidota bacterium]
MVVFQIIGNKKCKMVRELVSSTKSTGFDIKNLVFIINKAMIIKL